MKSRPDYRRRIRKVLNRVVDPSPRVRNSYGGAFHVASDKKDEDE